MKKFIIITALLFSLTTSLHSQWIKQYWPEFWNVYGVCFFDNNIGLVAGETFPSSLYKIYRTTNGGFNWSENYYFLVHGMQKVDSLTAYCWGVNWATGDDKILRTVDKGLTWDSINFGLNYIADIYFLTKDTGWVTIFDGNASRLYKTIDGGITLTFLNSTGSNQTTSFYLKEKYNGNYIGYRSNYQAVKKTTDGGYNWIDLPALPIVPQYDKNKKLLTTYDVNQIAFVNKDTGWVSNGSKNIFKTTNGGLTWIIQNMPNLNNSSSSFYNFKLINKDTLYSDDAWIGIGAHSYGIIFKTTNGGTNWGYQLPDTSVFPNAGISHPEFINSNTGWCTNIHTTNGGGVIILTEIMNIEVNNPEKYHLMQNYPNPFNPTTTIDFYLPKNSEVYLRVYDITGRLILKVIEGFQLTPGYHSYKIYGFSSLDLSSGVYFYKLTSSDKSGSLTFQATKKMIYSK